MAFATGIANLEEYMLGRIGIKAEKVHSKTHCFLKLKNISILTDEGEKKGDTLIDPTWNLGDQRFNTYPQHFCVNYETLRRADITPNGQDRRCHENDELADVTLQLDEQYLRRVYSSIRIRT